MRGGRYMGAIPPALLLLASLGGLSASRIQTHVTSVAEPVLHRRVQHEVHPGGAIRQSLAQQSVASHVGPAHSSVVASLAEANATADEAAAEAIVDNSEADAGAVSEAAVVESFSGESKTRVAPEAKSGGVPLVEGQILAGKIDKNLIVAGVATFTVVLFCCACGFMDRYFKFPDRSRPRATTTLSSKSGSKKASRCNGNDPNSPHGERQKHLHGNHVIYEWAQTTSVVTVYTRVPPGVSKGDLEINISSKHLQVGKRGKPPFLKEETHEEVDEKESAWRLRSNGELQINLHKVKKAEWPCVLLHKSDGDDKHPQRSGSKS
jgi:hypothetical protein